MSFCFNKRILHCPYNFANNWWILSRAERKLGIKSDLAVFDCHYFYPNFDLNLKIPGVSVPNEVKRWWFFRKALKEYDVFHFNFGHSIIDYPYMNLNFLDFPILKRMKKKIVISFQGNDARQKDIYMKKFGQKEIFAPYTLSDKYYDYIKRNRIKKIAKYADFIFALNPDIMHVLPRKTQFLPYAVNDFANKTIKKKQSRKITIVHAPSDRRIKGTAIVVQIVEKLAKKYPIDFKLVENVIHAKAMKIYSQADIAVDQLYLGWYGGFAAELMMQGVPTVSYLREEDLEKFIPFRKEIPIVNANPDNLSEVLVNLIENPSLRKKIGYLSKLYARKYHAPIKIARKMQKIYSE